MKAKPFLSKQSKCLKLICARDTYIHTTRPRLPVVDPNHRYTSTNDLLFPTTGPLVYSEFKTSDGNQNIT